MAYATAMATTAAMLLTLLLSSAVPTSASSPAPVSVPPSGLWNGIDGSWSSFNLSVGTPAQQVQTFVSWELYQMWVVQAVGCPGLSQSCITNRGGLFYMNESSTWDNNAIYGLDIENNLGLNGNANFGFDAVALGGPGDEILKLPNVTVGALATYDFYVGLLGINPKPTNWSSYQNSSPSYLTQLKDDNMIPSLSFGYTAGAPYRFDKVLGSLVLGGYDQSKFEPNQISFSFGADDSHDTVVAIQSVTTTQNSSSTTAQLLPSPIYALVDASIAELWLPLDACQAFEQQFGIVYDKATDLYLLDSSTHDALLARNASVNFTIAQQSTGGSTVTIEFPYAAFDLTAKSPYQGLSNDTHYFPLRRAANSTQYTLGRTFMQEAYISVDFEHEVFNLSKVIWQQDSSPQVVAISPTSSTSNSGSSASPSYLPPISNTGTTSSKLGGGAIAGICVVVAILVIAILVLLFCARKRRRNRRVVADERRRRPSTMSEAATSYTDTTMIESARAHTKNSRTTVDAVPTPAATPSSDETPSDGVPDFPIMGAAGSSRASNTTTEADGIPVHEMPGSLPDLALADGRQITEKDMMRHRERMYNGYDASAERRPDGGKRRSGGSRHRRSLVDASQVRAASEEEGGNPRFSFAEGQGTML